MGLIPDRSRKKSAGVQTNLPCEVQENGGKMGVLNSSFKSLQAPNVLCARIVHILGMEPEDFEEWGDILKLGLYPSFEWNWWSKPSCKYLTKLWNVCM